MCEQVSTLQRIIRPLRIAMIDVSSEAGQRELRQIVLGSGGHEVATDSMARQVLATVELTS